MNSDELRRIAETSGTSVSTVRRVLGHCAGIAEETRQTVIRARDALTPSADGSHRIHVILPDNPKYFWHQAFEVFNGYTFSPPAKFSFYPSLSQHETLRSYLLPLAEVDNAVLIIAANLNTEECETVARIAQHSLVIQLCEYTPLPGSVYVGADAYADGVALGEFAANEMPNARTVMFERAENHNMNARCRGFADGLATSVVSLPEPGDSKLYASLTARAISEHAPNAELVFCPSGQTAEVCRGLHKLRGQTRAVCVGTELSPTLKKMEERQSVLAVVQQNLAEQTRIALRLATDYLANGTRPAQPQYLVPSILWKQQNGEFIKV